MEPLNFNPLEVECTIFFQENPYSYETLHGLGRRLGRNPIDLQPVLEKLVHSTILEMIGEGDSAIYRYVQPKINQIDEMLI
ncbi:hypothetical protein [Evansella cellulosilytica]|uniref:Uncharacterized protein n=1 Tax=Evansella cellulosilytica (strain ATCC 21833 / DSM 2522 / FERM P-1141 / JCM 9156 / N-4) TaxID=649639 RepID=E6U2A7_EVAC2|nr:hypothetical protein [Evansella cellulosilytica]ADU30485.1 hypothetical protein Bcell_2225 [Evansella cellulosilytica DSM 2522]